jgi:hypothetical protein
LFDTVLGKDRIEGDVLCGETVAAKANPALLSIVSDHGFWTDVMFKLAPSMPFGAVNIGVHVEGE